LLSLKWHCLCGGLQLLLRRLQGLPRTLQALLLLLHRLTVQIVSYLPGAIATLCDLIKLLELLAVALGSHLLTLLLLLLLLWLLRMGLCLYMGD
jgi:hypothetical protein